MKKQTSNPYIKKEIKIERIEGGSSIADETGYMASADSRRKTPSPEKEG